MKCQLFPILAAMPLLLVQGCSSSSQPPASAIPKADSKAASLATESEKQAKAKAEAESTRRGKWIVQKSVSEMDDSPTVVLSLQAENEIRGWLKAFRPNMVLRCKENRTELYINVGMNAAVEYGDTRTVRARFDQDKKIWTYEMSQSTDGEALFVSGPIDDIKYLLTKKTVLYEFTPFNASPVQFRFDLTGLDDAIKPLREACRW